MAAATADFTPSDPDTTTCTHHQILYLCTPSPPETHVHIYIIQPNHDNHSTQVIELSSSRIDIAKLALFLGYRELGTFAWNTTEGCMEPASSEDEDEPPPLDFQFALFVATHARRLTASEDSTHFRIATLPILANAPLSSTTSHLSNALLWKWTKPSSPHRRSGYWEVGLEQMVEDAEWMAGRGASLCVAVVDKQVWSMVKEGRVRCLGLPGGVGEGYDLEEDFERLEAEVGG